MHISIHQIKNWLALKIILTCEASVVIPVKNRVDTIGDAIKSALTQKTKFSFNIIIVDNHSDDGTTEKIKIYFHWR